MQNPFLLIFRLPFWAFLVLAGGAIYLGEYLTEDAQRRAAERAAALASAPPALVDLANFDKAADIALGDEVMVSGWINPDYNYHLTDESTGTGADDGRYIFMLFGESDTGASRQVRAAFSLSAQERQLFIDTMAGRVIGQVDGGPVLQINGTAHPRAAMTELFDEALAEQGLVRAENFTFISPFSQGRAAGLSAPDLTAERTRTAARGLAGLLALIAIVQLFMGRRRARSLAAIEAALAADATEGANLALDSDGAQTETETDLDPSPSVSKAGKGFNSEGFDPKAQAKTDKMTLPVPVWIGLAVIAAALPFVAGSFGSDRVSDPVIADAAPAATPNPAQPGVEMSGPGSNAPVLAATSAPPPIAPSAEARAAAAAAQKEATIALPSFEQVIGFMSDPATALLLLPVLCMFAMAMVMRSSLGRILERMFGPPKTKEDILTDARFDRLAAEVRGGADA